MRLPLKIFFVLSAFFCAGLACAAPTISSTTINSDNSELTVTFSEAVYTTTGGTGNLVPSDFTLSRGAGGSATNPLIANVSKTSDTVWVLAFAITGTADGLERISVVPASSSSIYDGAGNAAAVVQTFNNVLLNEKILPTITSVSITSNNAAPALAVHSNVVTLTFTASETLSAAVVTFSSGGTAIASSRVLTTNSGNAYTSVYTANQAIDPSNYHVFG